MTAELPSEIELVGKSCRKRNNNRRRSCSRIEESCNNRIRSFEESFDELQCENVVRAKRQETKQYSHCFICNEKKKTDIKTFNDDGLRRCSMISPKENILSCMKKRLLDKLNNYYNAAKRVDIIMLIGINYDVFAADVYYHKACHNRFRY